MPDAMRGEVVTAVTIVRQDAEITNGALLRHCRRQLEAAKSPRHVVRWTELPKSAMGKVDKPALRARLIESAALSGVKSADTLGSHRLAPQIR